MRAVLGREWAIPQDKVPPPMIIGELALAAVAAPRMARVDERGACRAVSIDDTVAKAACLRMQLRAGFAKVGCDSAARRA
jgi:hypothetical protein